MRYLMRESALLNDRQWELIDQAVVNEAKRVLVGRRVISIEGPLGAQTQTVPLDAITGLGKANVDFWADQGEDAIKVASRRYVQLATLYSDFMISWRDIESEDGAGVQAAIEAAMVTASSEDTLLFYGNKELGIDGLLTAKGINKIAISDWSKDENPILDLAKALEMLLDKNNSGDRALILSSDLWAKLHRLQPGTGLMEIDRVRGLVSGEVLKSNRLEKNKAILLYTDPHNVDMVVGQDLITAYLGNEGLDHAFRVMETVTPRIKRPSAIAVLG